ncbi:MAG: glycosyltransferase, partial [Bacteroidales bacterium]
IIPHERHWFDRPLGRYFTDSCDAFITLSKEVLHDLQSFNSSKPRRYYPHPLYDNYGKILSKDEACRQLGLDPGWIYFLFFGFIRDYKGLDWLLETFANPAFQGKKVRLLIAGEFYTHPEPYKKIIENHPFKDKILLFDQFIPDSEVNLWFSVADLVVQPYKSATQSGVSQIALYFEKPVVVTDVGGLAEQIPHGKAGWVVEPRPEALADAMLEFLRSYNSIDWQTQIRKVKNLYSWGGLVETFELLCIEN